MEEGSGSSTNFIPFELTVEILCRLPGEALIRFQYVSKLWFSIIRSKDLADSFLVRSKTRPRFLLTFKHFGSRKRFIFSAPEHQRNNKFPTVVARHDMTISELVYYIRTRPVNGFVCCTRGSSIAVCNPTTRQIVKLPDVVSNGRQVYARLGYDPVGDQYKVLCVMVFNFDSALHLGKGFQLEHYVFTLQSQQKEWRKIEITQDVRYHDVHEGICINGDIYYIAEGSSGIIRFDVRSEKLDLIQAPEESYDSSSLLNYNGKLGCVDLTFDEMVLWILEDAEKQEWSELQCAQPDDLDDLVEDYVNLKGEIRTVYIEGIADDEFRRVHGIGKRTREIWSFPSFVKNIMFL